MISPIPFSIQMPTMQNRQLIVLTWYHYLFLANGAQGPYNVTNSAFNPGGTVGIRDLGHEIDLLGTYKINTRSDLIVGYSHFFAGGYYDKSLTSSGAALFNGVRPPTRAFIRFA